MSTPREGEYLPKEWIEVSEVHGDLSQEVVRITVDRLTLILHRHVSSVERRKEWIAPAGILTTLILTFVSTTFQDKILKSATWEALFIMVSIAVVAWLIVALWRSAKSCTVDELVDVIKRHDR